MSALTDLGHTGAELLSRSKGGTPGQQPGFSRASRQTLGRSGREAQRRMWPSRWQVSDLAAIVSKELESSVKFFCCYDEQGTLIARCQTMADVDVLKKMGRPVVRVAEMTDEESVVCSLTDTPAEFNQDY